MTEAELTAIARKAARIAFYSGAGVFGIVLAVAALMLLFRPG